jgi:hypothetical protein
MIRLRPAPGFWRRLKKELWDGKAAPWGDGTGVSFITPWPRRAVRYLKREYVIGSLIATAAVIVAAYHH